MVRATRAIKKRLLPDGWTAGFVLVCFPAGGTAGACGLP